MRGVTLEEAIEACAEMWAAGNEATAEQWARLAFYRRDQELAWWLAERAKGREERPWPPED